MVQPTTIRIVAPSRIHCALLNLSGAYGRIDGGLGFAVEEPVWDIALNKQARDKLVENTRLDAEARDAILLALACYKSLAGECGVEIAVNKSVPSHVGLGAKTSLLLAVATGIHYLFDVPPNFAQIAETFGRGSTSGIGVNTFENGGFLWDLGHSLARKQEPFLPSSVSRAQCPKAISIARSLHLSVVHFRFDESGLYGEKEVSFFRQHCPLSPLATQETLAIVSGGLIPSLVDNDEPMIQRHLSHLQQVGFKRLEWLAQGEKTLRFEKYWMESGIPVALALSSLGSTMYAITSQPDVVLSAIDAFEEQPLHLTCTKVAYSGVRRGAE